MEKISDIQEMSDGFIRQRRNLLGVSIFLFLISFGDVELTKINILGNNAEIKEPDIILYSLIVLLIYFLIRFYQYFNGETYIQKYIFGNKSEHEAKMCIILHKKMTEKLNLLEGINYDFITRLILNNYCNDKNDLTIIVDRLPKKEDGLLSFILKKEFCYAVTLNKSQDSRNTDDQGTLDLINKYFDQSEDWFKVDDYPYIVAPKISSIYYTEITYSNIIDKLNSILIKSKSFINEPYILNYYFPFYFSGASLIVSVCKIAFSKLTTNQALIDCNATSFFCFANVFNHGF